MSQRLSDLCSKVAAKQQQAVMQSGLRKWCDPDHPPPYFDMPVQDPGMRLPSAIALIVTSGADTRKHASELCVPIEASCVDNSLVL